MEWKYIFLDLYVLLVMLVIWCALATVLYHIAKWMYAFVCFAIQKIWEKFN